MIPYLMAFSEVFPDSYGVLEGEKLVRVSGLRYILRYCEQPVVHYDSDSDPNSRLKIGRAHV